MRWEATPEGLAATRYEIFAGGERLSVIHFPLLGGSTAEPLAGRVYHLRRAGAFRQRFWLQAAEGETVAQAAQASFWRPDYRVSAGNWEGMLRLEGAFRGGYALMIGERRVGTLRASSTWGRGLEADLPDDLSPALGLFIVWVVLYLWRRRSVTAAGTAGAVAARPAGR